MPLVDPEPRAESFGEYFQRSTQMKNHAPLFWADGDGHDPKTGFVYRRGGLLGAWKDINDYSYTRVWSAALMTAGSLLPDT